ncbi:MAG: hypothetical protein MUC95_09430 [Spirochaetes bacterium]|nr:hypothetical protein [Spirochaetota bacterium]
MSVKKSIRLDDYEKGLLIHVITDAISGGTSFSEDDMKKLKDLKKRLQGGNGAK